ncbi:MAG: hypothetical protein H0V63_13345 [Burkholderiaceae bacterium]|nr:hypothetical protein [Burkholderiaceae bacterium]
MAFSNGGEGDDMYGNDVIVELVDREGGTVEIAFTEPKAKGARIYLKFQLTDLVTAVMGPA